MLADEWLYRFIPQEAPTDLASLRERYRGLSRGRAPADSALWLNWVARHSTTGEPIGLFQSTVLPDHQAFLAYMVFPGFWKQGFAIECCREIMGHLFAQGVVRLCADIDTRNHASIALIERLGFARVGFTPGADVFKGVVSDELRYELASPHP